MTCFAGTPSPAIAGVLSTPASHALRNSTEGPDMDDGILWAVPKSRRSRERRVTRKFGSETDHYKMLRRKHLITCHHCGNVHQPGRLCRKSQVYSGGTRVIRGET